MTPSGRNERQRGATLRSAGTTPTDPLNRGLMVLERPGRAWAGLLFAVLLVVLALQRVSLGVRPTYLGKYYAMLAADPFHPSADNPVGHRILAPLLSWAAGLRGPYLLYTDLLAVLALLAAAYLWFRGRDHAPAWAIVGASTLAFTMASLTTLHYGCYPDVWTYLFVFGAWWARGRLWAACVLFLAALLCHESAVFLTPWLLIVLARSGAERAHGWPRAGAALVATLIVFAAFRTLHERAHPSVAYTMGFYLAPLRDDPLHWFRESAPHRLLGVAAAFNLYWAVPLLAAARMATLAFMSVLLGTEYLLRTNGFGARRWIVLLGLASFWIPQVNVAMGAVDFMGRR